MISIHTLIGSNWCQRRHNSLMEIFFFQIQIIKVYDAIFGNVKRINLIKFASILCCSKTQFEYSIYWGKLMSERFDFHNYDNFNEKFLKYFRNCIEINTNKTQQVSYVSTGDLVLKVFLSGILRLGNRSSYRLLASKGLHNTNPYIKCVGSPDRSFQSYSNLTSQEIN